MNAAFTVCETDRMRMRGGRGGLAGLGPAICILAGTVLCAQAAGWNSQAWTGDADSGVSSSYVYTCAVNLGGGTASVNGVVFQVSALAGPGFSIGGGVATFNGDVNSLTNGGGSGVLATDFIYGGYPRTVELTGLTPGVGYEANFFSVGWEAAGRVQTFATGSEALTVDQDAYGDNNGIRISYGFVADASGARTFTITPADADTFHLYALANRVVPGPSNAEASAVTADSARLNGVLACPGTAFQVYAYWGPVDGGTNAAAWATHAFVGSYTNVAATNLTWLVTGLAEQAEFFYTFRATNLAADVWASPSVAFLTAGVSVQATDAFAYEHIADAGQFTVFRPAALTNGELTVNYTLGGTASNGLDYAALSGSVVIPAGADRATVTVMPIDNEPIDYWRTVDLSLAPGGYAIGMPAGATVRIGDRSVLRWWAYKAQVTFAGAGGLGPLTNFPVLVRLSSDRMAGFDYDQFASPNGSDLRFVDGAASRYLAYEVEQWNTNGESLIWVQVPLLTGSNDTLWVYWGLAAATNPPSFADNGAAWDASFAGVWHLNADLRDSSGNGNQGVNVGTTATNGAVGAARAIDGAGGHRVDGGGGASLQVSGAFTVSLWMAPDTLAGDAPLVAFAWPGWNGDNRDLIFNLSLRGQMLRFDYGWQDGLLYAAWWGFGGYVQAGEVGQWLHVALTYAGDRMYMYKNGQPIGDWATAHFPLKNYGGVMHFGHWPNNSAYTGTFDGGLDEVRLEHVERSADWIRACWLNQNADAEFLVYGAAQEILPPTGLMLIVR